MTRWVTNSPSAQEQVLKAKVRHGLLLTYISGWEPCVTKGGNIVVIPREQLWLEAIDSMKGFSH